MAAHRNVNCSLALFSAVSNLPRQTQTGIPLRGIKPPAKLVCYGPAPEEASSYKY